MNSMQQPEPNQNAREFVLDFCHQMTVGWHELFAADVVQAGWPATGECDDRPTGILGVSVGEFASLAAAYAGNRPIGGQTTLDGFRASLGSDEFEVKYRAEQSAYEVHRIRDRKAKPAVLARAGLPRASDWKKYRVVGGVRNGTTISILHGRRAKVPKPDTNPVEFENYTLKHVAALGGDALVLEGLDDEAAAKLVAGSGFEPPYPSL